MSAYVSSVFFQVLPGLEELRVYSWTSAGPSYPQWGGLLGLPSAFGAVTWADELTYVKAFVSCKA